MQRYPAVPKRPVIDDRPGPLMTIPARSVSGRFPKWSLGILALGGAILAFAAYEVTDLTKQSGPYLLGFSVYVSAASVLLAGFQLQRIIGSAPSKPDLYRRLALRRIRHDARSLSRLTDLDDPSKLQLEECLTIGDRLHENVDRLSYGYATIEIEARKVEEVLHGWLRDRNAASPELAQSLTALIVACRDALGGR